MTSGCGGAAGGGDGGGSGGGGGAVGNQIADSAVRIGQVYNTAPELSDGASQSAGSWWQKTKKGRR